MSTYQLNFTELEDKEAVAKLSELRDMVLRGESDRSKRSDRYVENTDLWLNNIWSDDDLAFFDDLDMVPYEYPVQRPLINNLITQQRETEIGFEIVPTDLYSYKRQREGRDKFMAEEMAKENSAFTTAEEAGEFYDKYADDEYARAASIYLHNIRHESKGKDVDTTVFQQGLVTGMDVWKAVYSKKYNREGSIEITRRPQNAIFYDESSVEKDFSDVEFIGEVHRLYKSQLTVQYPEHKEKIEEYFQFYTNKKRTNLTREMQDWKYFYEFDYNYTVNSRVKVAEMYILETEERIQVTDTETGDTRIVEYGIEEDAVVDQLMSMVLIELQSDEGIAPQLQEAVQTGAIKEQVAQIVQERFEITTVMEPVWFKAVFTYNALFEYKRSELPHNSHPYMPYFAQYTEGEFRGIMDDIKDIIININKTLAFRDLMMAHSAKNVLVVDEDTLAKSGYDLDEISSNWTSIGSIIALKLKPGKRLQDVVQTFSSVGDTLPAINNVLADLDNRLYQISGVNLAQLGIQQRETTASGFRDQIKQGQTNNGLIYHNFYSALEDFYNHKVVPLVVEYMKMKPKHVLRRIGEEYEPWLEVELEEDFDLFASAIRSGQFNTLVKPKTDNAQIQQERAAQYMEMAMAGLLDPEIAIEFSNDPNRHRILRRMKEKELERIQRQAYSQFSFQEFMQIAAESGLPMDAIEELLDKMKREKAKQMSQDNSGEQIQRRQGGQGAQAAPAIRSAASETQRLVQIDAQANLNQQ